MAYTRSTTIDTAPGGDTGKQGFIDLDADLTNIFSCLNTHEGLTTGIHGVGAGNVVGTTLTQTLTNKTLSGATFTGSITSSGATFTGGIFTNPTINSGTLTTPTITGTVITSNATFTGGTFTNPAINGSTLTSPTITGTVTSNNATFTGGTFTNPAINGSTLTNSTITGTVTASSTTISSILDKISTTSGKYLGRGGSVWDAYNLDQLKPISASVGSNNLTLSTSSMLLDFRSATLTSGSITSGVAVGALSLVVPSGATLGTINATQSQLVLVILYNSGSPELGVVNLSGGINLDETTLLSTTAISSAADSADVIYSTNAITNSPFRVVGYVRITETTAGTWATAPTLVQGSGGQALAALSSLGYGQTWQDVTGSRSLGTTYYNTTGRPIKLRMYGSGTTTYAGRITLTINGTDIVFLASSSTSGANQISDEILIPPGASYVGVATHTNVYYWYELR